MQKDRYIFTDDGKERIGFDKYVQPITKYTNIAIPHCSNCYAVLQFPGATSEEQYYIQEKAHFEKWKSNMISRHNGDIIDFQNAKPASKKEQPASSGESLAWLGAIVSSSVLLYGYYLIKTEPVGFYYQNPDSHWGLGVMLVAAGVIFLLLSLLGVLKARSKRKDDLRGAHNSYELKGKKARQAEEEIKHYQRIEYSHENYVKYVMR
jgi:hypothetical protein